MEWFILLNSFNSYIYIANPFELLNQRTRQAHSALRFVRLVSASPSFKPVQLAHLNQ